MFTRLILQQYLTIPFSSQTEPGKPIPTPPTSVSFMPASLMISLINFARSSTINLPSLPGTVLTDIFLRILPSLSINPAFKLMPPTSIPT